MSESFNQLEENCFNFLMRTLINIASTNNSDRNKAKAAPSGPKKGTGKKLAAGL
ncbi:MAG TPA: hypothetical protein VMT35_09230 [Ignavibacteriaceae bacterium]|nr:hypothetical protein [Ignavibacteriaceae bacterium]